MTQGNLIIKKRENGDVVAIQTEIPVGIEKKTRNWIVYSPDFKTIGHSEVSKDEAIKDFKEALRIFFLVHIKRGSLEKTLDNFCWEKIDHSLIGAKRFNSPISHLQPELISENFEYA